MSYLSSFFALIAATFISACVPVPIPIIVPLGATSTAPVQRLAATPPRSASVDQTLNRLRADNGRGAIASNTALDRVAAQYAADLAVGDKLMMGLPTGARAGGRIKAAGVSNCTAGEVISQGYPSAEAALSAWLSDRGNRSILMNPRYVNYGLGQAPDRAGRGADVWVLLLLQAC